ncbi:hypothetical protein NUW58_g294 [Xylaria curta]|uniref:Uncharacterized protein n=1 Tax=Xylaria curta TaxID=42375 RepID=A0ACC1PRF8_9PEZI|nr:hypothetical protein NUW58_g294 [Xylaria curta]
MESDDDDLSSQPDLYARDNHLSIDSQINPFSLAFQISDSVPQLTPDAGPSGLTSDDRLPHLHLPTLDLWEQLDVPKESKELLLSVIQRTDFNLNDYPESPLVHYEARKRLAKLKLDPPVLCSDPDYDCCELARAIHKQRLPQISPEIFPLERLNLNNDEGLGFSASTYQARRTLDHRIRHEKLDVPKEAICHLTHALRDGWSDSENRRVIEEAMPRRACACNLAVTPPLSPYVENEEPFVPSPEVCEVPLASDPGSMLSDDLKAAESTVVQKELEKDVLPMLDMEYLRLSPLLEPLAPVGELPKISSTKLESPLSPITSPLRSPNEGANIVTLLKSIDVDHVLSRPESSKVALLRTDSLNDAIDLGLKAEMEESAVAVLKSIEQENISIADAIARVEVPIMDFSIPEPEWQSLPMDPWAHLKWLYKSYNIKIPPYLRDSRADSKLRWVPFLHSIDSQMLTRENIDSEITLSSFLNFLDVNETPTSANYVWKRPGLSILREMENEEPLDEITPLARAMYGLTSLARKRRMENDLVEKGMSSSSSKSSSPIDFVGPCRYERPLQPTLSESLVDRTSILPNVDSNATVSALLSSYMDVHTTKRRKQDKSPFFLPTSKHVIETRSLSAPMASRSKRGNPSPSKAQEQPQKEAKSRAPCPKINVSNPPTKLIKGLTLSRRLLSDLEQLYPSAEIIERDFDRWNNVVWGHSSVIKPTIVSSLVAEADVIVSPATGIIVTTLLRVIQKPLPGHGGQSAIRKRISCVALRYERLVVLVSEGNTVDETAHDLTPSETAAYAGFMGFIAGLNCKIEVFYVGGGEATLSRWLVSLAVHHAPEAAEVQQHLIQDESQWEVFLRRVGLNAYAAQSILVRLKANDHGSIGEECSKHGLVSFLTMTDVERLQRFRDLMGGECVLNRANELLKMRWG